MNYQPTLPGRIFLTPARFRFLTILIVFLASITFQPGLVFPGDQLPEKPISIEVSRWQAAERIFHADPRWLGGDGAATVDMGQGRVLWLFGDSFIDLSGSGNRRAASLVRNSIAVQTGYNPMQATMHFYWQSDGKKPAAVFRDDGQTWFWPGSGIMVGKRLLIFLMQIRKAENALGFEPCGWRAVVVNNPGDAPSAWKLKNLKSPSTLNIIMGTGNPIVQGGFILVFGTDWKDGKAYVMRWPAQNVQAGDLSHPQWWAGPARGWASVSPAQARSIASGMQTEFSIEYMPRLKRYIQIQTLSLMKPCLSMSAAKTVTGPWSAKACIYQPPNRGEVLVYAGKSHPMLRGADMILTYIVNTNSMERLLEDMSIYYPVMLKGHIQMQMPPPSKP